MSKINLGKDLYIKGRIGWQGLSKDEYLEKGDYKIINATALMDGYVNWDNCGYISKERYEEAKDIQLKENDILISKDGTLGKIGYVKDLKIPCSVASGIFVLRNTATEKIDFDYLYHLLKSSIFKDFIYRNKSLGSTISHLYQRDLENFEIELPPLEEQKRIANILNLLDSKITLNNKINKTLEAQTKTIYNYWFNQFEFPNEDGKPYKSSGGKMVWNEELKKEIPEGWAVEKLENCIDTIIDRRGVTPKKLGGDWVKNGIIALSAKVVKNGRLLDLSNANRVSLEMYDKWMPQKLTNGDILMTSEAPLGEFYYMYDEPDYCLSQRLFAIRASKNISSLYLYYELSKGNGISQIRGKSSGSTVFGIRQDELRKVKVLIPNKKIMTDFENEAISYIAMDHLLNKENQALASIRDFLLPMLMNGQITFEE